MARGDDHEPMSLIDMRRLPPFKRETLQVVTLNPTSQTPESRRHNCTVEKGPVYDRYKAVSVKNLIKREVSEARNTKFHRSRSLPSATRSELD